MHPTQRKEKASAYKPEDSGNLDKARLNEQLFAEAHLSFLEPSSRPYDQGLVERDQRLTQGVSRLFRDSIQAFSQEENNQHLLKGEPLKWRPILRDAYGKTVHSPGVVLVNPSLDPLMHNPVIQLVPPNPRFLGQVSRQPIVKLVRSPDADYEGRTMRLIESVVNPNTANGQRQLTEAMAQYRLINLTTDPTRPQDFKRGLHAIVVLTLLVNDKRADKLVDDLLRLHPIYRSTFHPDVGVVGRQWIEQKDVPVAYKGVPLQPDQIRNLLLGNTIEVNGIRDPGRASLYRAGVSFNLLRGQTDEVSRSEQIKTDNQQETKRHRQVVERQDDDSLRLKPRSEQDPLRQQPTATNPLTARNSKPNL